MRTNEPSVSIMPIAEAGMRTRPVTLRRTRSSGSGRRGPFSCPSSRIKRMIAYAAPRQPSHIRARKGGSAWRDAFARTETGSRRHHQLHEPRLPEFSGAAPARRPEALPG
jgi:hypothetical protein